MGDEELHPVEFFNIFALMFIGFMTVMLSLYAWSWWTGLGVVAGVVALASSRIYERICLLEQELEVEQ